MRPLLSLVDLIFPIQLILAENSDRATMAIMRFRSLMEA